MLKLILETFQQKLYRKIGYCIYGGFIYQIAQNVLLHLIKIAIPMKWIISLQIYIIRSHSFLYLCCWWIFKYFDLIYFFNFSGGIIRFHDICRKCFCKYLKNCITQNIDMSYKTECWICRYNISFYLHSLLMKYYCRYFKCSFCWFGGIISQHVCTKS